MKYLANAVVFVILYVIFMLPTYYLPYLGSNSSIVNTMTNIDTGSRIIAPGMNPAFWPHLGCLVALIAITWLRGSFVKKQWLVIFPVVATVFDLAPVLSSIPMVPTIMHLLAIILGAIGAKVIVQAAEQST